MEGWQARQAGLELAEFATPRLDALAARVDLERWRLVSVTAPLIGTRRRATLDAMVDTVGAVAGVNGGFFDREERPEGLRVSDGRVLSQPVHRDWGVFYVTENRPHLIHTRDAPSVDWSRTSFAVQCGPRIISAGAALKVKITSHRRTVIGIDKSGRVVLLATRNEIDLNELARALLRSPSAGGLGLVEALALDGGPSTGFLAPATERAPRQLVLPPRTPLADAVLVTRPDAPMPYDDLTDFPTLARPLVGWTDVP